MTAAITDFTQYTALRTAAGQNDPAALREVASQFEALFLQDMLKSMRNASLGDPLIGNSDQHDMYQDMMDKQLALEMASGKGIGLADMLIRQLGGTETSKLSEARSDYPIRVSRTANNAVAAPAWSDPQAFARDIWPHAKRTARQLNVAPEALVAQAALETGWGKHVMPDQSGASSFNLFGIKGGGKWSGGEVVKRTLEFENGVPQPRQEKFRAYASVGSAFADYEMLIAANPRYENVRGNGNDTAGFARALQDSGYATDPDYAEKIENILDSPTMRRVMSNLKTDI